MIHRTFSKDIQDGIMPPAIEPLFPSEAWSPPASIQGNLRQRKLYIGLGNDLGSVDVPFFRSSGGSLGWEYVQTPAGRLMMRGSWNTALYGELDKIYSQLRDLPDYPQQTETMDLEGGTHSPKEDSELFLEPSSKKRKLGPGVDISEPDHRQVKLAKAFVVHKNRLSGLWGQTTPLEELLHSRGISTLLFSGVNTDQYVILILIRPSMNSNRGCVLYEIHVSLYSAYSILADSPPNPIFVPSTCFRKCCLVSLASTHMMRPF